MNPMAKAIIHKQMAMVKKMKQQQKLQNAFLSKVGQKKAIMDDEDVDVIEA